jgi:imidazolonepropionase-like amidohydrolase
VHLAFYPVAEQLAQHGVRAVVDLASPESTLGTKSPIQVIRSGPMLTHPNGYPLDAWGSDGYGIGCDSVDCVNTTIERLHREGARVIKLALDDDGLDPSLVRPAIDAAHRLRLKVVVHALTNESVERAGREGADVLAHTPLEPLSQKAIEAWRVVVPPHTWQGMVIQSPNRRERAVITTLAAFGGSPAAIENLRKLRAVGVTVLYGTDLGNLRVDGPSGEEMALMKQAGMTDGEVQDAMIAVPLHFWGFDAMGPIPGKPAGGS